MRRLLDQIHKVCFSARVFYVCAHTLMLVVLAPSEKWACSRESCEQIKKIHVLSTSNNLKLTFNTSTFQSNFF